MPPKKQYRRPPKRSRNDPVRLLEVARALRRQMEDKIPKTWAQFYAKLRDSPPYPIIDWATAYWFTRLVQEQGERDCTYDQAAEAVTAVCPELYAEYWSRPPAGKPG